MCERSHRLMSKAGPLRQYLGQGWKVANGDLICKRSLEAIPDAGL